VKSEASDTPRNAGLESAAETLPMGAVHGDSRDLLEVLFFASEDLLDITRLCELLEMEKDRILDLIDNLNKDYRDQGRSFAIRPLAGGYQLVSRRRYGSLLRRLLKTRVRPRLSRAALETLAVTAYKQPVTKSEIESIRGVKTEGVLKTLLDRRLVAIAGRSEAVGRPLLYRTTREFLEYFGMAGMEDLPKLKEIQELVKGARDGGDEQLPPARLQELLPHGGMQGKPGPDETAPAAGPAEGREEPAADETSPGAS